MGTLHGCFNQTDRRGNLLPWTARSAGQLLSTCLDAIGERHYEIDLPDAPGPPVEWDGADPVNAFWGLVRRLRPRLQFHPVTNVLLITAREE